jgi:hypothetical protein
MASFGETLRFREIQYVVMNHRSAIDRKNTQAGMGFYML